MPKTHPTAFRNAEAEAKTKAAYLYIIQHGDDLFHLTNHDVSLSVTSLPAEKGSDPQTFTRASIQHSTLEQKAEIGSNEMSLTIGINQGPFSAELREMVLFTTPKKISVTIMRVNSENLPGAVEYGEDTYTVFKGVGVSLVFSSQTVAISMVSVIMQTDGMIPIWVYAKTCQLVFGGSRCGLNLDQNQFRLATTLSAVNFRWRYVDVANTTLNGNPITAAMFQGGKLTEMDGVDEIGTIGIHTSEVLPASAGTRLYLAWWSRTIVAGESVKVFRGCNRTFAQCTAFTNQANFRNYPYIPNTSPAVHGA